MNHRIFERTWRFRKSSGSMLVSVSVATLQRRLVCKKHRAVRWDGGLPGWAGMWQRNSFSPWWPEVHMWARGGWCFLLLVRASDPMRISVSIAWCGGVTCGSCRKAGAHGAQPAPSVWLGCASPEHTKSCVAWEAASHAVCRAWEVLPPAPPLTPQFNDRT